MVTDDDMIAMFEPSASRMHDGSISLLTMTMKAICAMPERCKRANGGKGDAMKIAIFCGEATATKQIRSARTAKVFAALTGQFAAVRYDEEGKADAIFKSGTIFLPIGHDAMVAQVERRGRLPFALEFSSEPADNKAGFRWLSRNLAQLDRNNLSVLDRIVIEGARRSAARC